ncbi:MAG: hypothetical protein HKO93_03800, partial [Flavobacteriales bacterium]|nr:hypothetical protein [Flavobacteriales bacterium]
MFALWTGCESDSDEPNDQPANGSARVLITCEGAFQGNSASISLYNEETSSVENNAFENVNAYGLGDVLQSVTEFDGKIYAVLNNSGKIEVMQKSTLESELPINGLISPRELVIVNSQKGYVSNLFTNNVQILDLESKTITGNIDVNGWSEGMVLVGEKLFVSKSNGDKVMVIDITTDELVDSIAVTLGPQNMDLDTDGMIWLATNGNFGAVEPKIHKIDPQDNTLIGTYDIPAPYSYAIKLAMNNTADQVYVLNNGVYTMFIGDNELSNDELISSNSAFYGLGI